MASSGTTGLFLPIDSLCAAMLPIPGIPMPMPKPPKPAFPPLPPPPFPPPFFPPFLIHGGSGCPMPSPWLAKLTSPESWMLCPSIAESRELAGATWLESRMNFESLPHASGARMAPTKTSRRFVSVEVKRQTLSQFYFRTSPLKTTGLYLPCPWHMTFHSCSGRIVEESALFRPDNWRTQVPMQMMSTKGSRKGIQTH